MILSHHIQIGIGGDLLGNETHHSLGSGETVGQNEMANEEAPLSYTTPIQLKVANLAVHLLNCLPIDPGIVLDAGEAPCVSLVGILHIRHIDIDDAIEKLQGIQRLIATAVID
jgi:hypothetical protein